MNFPLTIAMHDDHDHQRGNYFMDVSLENLYVNIEA